MAAVLPAGRALLSCPCHLSPATVPWASRTTDWSRVARSSRRRTLTSCGTRACWVSAAATSAWRLVSARSLAALFFAPSLHACCPASPNLSSLPCHTGFVAAAAYQLVYTLPRWQALVVSRMTAAGTTPARVALLMSVFAALFNLHTFAQAGRSTKRLGARRAAARVRHLPCPSGPHQPAAATAAAGAGV